MTKCLHEACFNEAEEMSSYCKDCVNLPIEKCNGCYTMQDSRPIKKSAKMKENTIVRMKERYDDPTDNDSSHFLWLAFKAFIYIVAIVLLINLLKMVW
jgi:hypothetical protein